MIYCLWETCWTKVYAKGEVSSDMDRDNPEIPQNATCQSGKNGPVWLLLSAHFLTACQKSRGVRFVKIVGASKQALTK